MVEAILFDRVTKEYDGTIAVSNFEMRASQGEIVALLGPNGSGKTTLMRIAVGILRPTEGDVYIFGHSITKEPIEAKKYVGYVPEDAYVYDSLSGYENVQLVADLWGIDLSEREDYLIRLAQILEMGQALDQLVSTYSAGMKRKLAIMMALIHDPRLLIIDEITANLDPKGLSSIELILAGLKKNGVTTLFSTHILEVAEALADRVVIIHRGQKIWEGLAKDIRAEAEEGGRLKDLYFELTGGPEYEMIIEFLRMREKHERSQSI